MPNNHPVSLAWKVFHSLDGFGCYAIFWKVVLFFNRANIHCKSLWGHCPPSINLINNVSIFDFYFLEPLPMSQDDIFGW